MERCDKSMLSKSLGPTPRGFLCFLQLDSENLGPESILFLFPLFYRWRNLAMYLTLRLIIFHLFFLITPFSSNQVRIFLS